MLIYQRFIDYLLEASIGIEPMNQSFADSCLTAWLTRHLLYFYKKNGAGNGNRTRNLTLARLCFTTKLYLH